MSNRVVEAIERTKLQIAKRLEDGLTDQDKLTALHKVLDMEMDEFVRFQELKSIASIDGTLTLEEGMTVYGYLGETPDHFNSQSLEVKSVLTQVFKDLLGRQTRTMYA